jgi:hypothetical protein
LGHRGEIIGAIQIGQPAGEFLQVGRGDPAVAVEVRIVAISWQPVYPAGERLGKKGGILLRQYPVPAHVAEDDGAKGNRISKQGDEAEWKEKRKRSDRFVGSDRSV